MSFMDREQHVLALIRQNPFISQQEMASIIGISRSAVAGYIAALTKKGIIRGRAYIMAEEQTVLCLGGANLDSKATAKQVIRMASSNPVSVTESCGGVARNIAETLAGLGCRTSLFTIVGDDKAGAWVLEETRKRGVDVSQSVVLKDGATGTYTALLDPEGEMALAFANMDIYDQYTPALLQEKWPHIAAAKLIIADTNLPPDTLAELIGKCREEGISLFIDPVSSEKAKKLPADLTGVTAIFPNLEEAQLLAGSPYDDTSRLAEAIRARGAAHVFITLGSKGVFYHSEEQIRLFPPLPTKVVEVTGAGDAFLAGVAYAVLHQQSYLEACSYGLAAAHLTLQTHQSAASELTEERLLHTVTPAAPQTNI
ncbi:carbohydrate kinase [Paenibacillus oryzisoli]|uniref:carbohydrate kinase n=1 Tax=Paenibacillus oryzisoli TaxID=1850517 RepID=UPI003D26C0E4